MLHSLSRALHDEGKYQFNAAVTDDMTDRRHDIARVFDTLR